MAEPKWTPKPWDRNIKPGRKYPTIFAGRNKHVARIVSTAMDDAEIEANIDLIVAAPELHDALVELYDALCLHHPEFVDSPLGRKTRTLLAKARGEGQSQ